MQGEGGGQPTNPDNAVPRVITQRDAPDESGGRKSSAPLRCKVEGCQASLASAPKTHQRFRLCNEHIKAPLVLVDGVHSRFCQQCSRFHEISDFEGTNRTCRMMLAKNRARQRSAAAQRQTQMQHVQLVYHPAVQLPYTGQPGQQQLLLQARVGSPLLALQPPGAGVAGLTAAGLDAMALGGPGLEGPAGLGLGAAAGLGGAAGGLVPAGGMGGAMLPATGLAGAASGGLQPQAVGAGELRPLALAPAGEAVAGLGGGLGAGPGMDAGVGALLPAFGSSAAALAPVVSWPPSPTRSGGPAAAAALRLQAAGGGGLPGQIAVCSAGAGLATSGSFRAGRISLEGPAGRRVSHTGSADSISGSSDDIEPPLHHREPPLHHRERRREAGADVRQMSRAHAEAARDRMQFEDSAVQQQQQQRHAEQQEARHELSPGLAGLCQTLFSPSELTLAVRTGAAGGAAAAEDAPGRIPHLSVQQQERVALLGQQGATQEQQMQQQQQQQVAAGSLGDVKSAGGGHKRQRPRDLGEEPRVVEAEAFVQGGGALHMGEGRSVHDSPRVQRTASSQAGLAGAVDVSVMVGAGPVSAGAAVGGSSSRSGGSNSGAAAGTGTTSLFARMSVEGVSGPVRRIGGLGGSSGTLAGAGGVVAGGLGWGVRSAGQIATAPAEAAQGSGGQGREVGGSRGQGESSMGGTLADWALDQILAEGVGTTEGAPGGAGGSGGVVTLSGRGYPLPAAAPGTAGGGGSGGGVEGDPVAALAAEWSREVQDDPEDLQQAVRAVREYDVSAAATVRRLQPPGQPPLARHPSMLPPPPPQRPISPVPAFARASDESSLFASSHTQGRHSSAGTAAAAMAAAGGAMQWAAAGIAGQQQQQQQQQRDVDTGAGGPGSASRRFARRSYGAEAMSQPSAPPEVAGPQLTARAAAAAPASEAGAHAAASGHPVGGGEGAAHPGVLGAGSWTLGGQTALGPLTTAQLQRLGGGPADAALAALQRGQRSPAPLGGAELLPSLSQDLRLGAQVQQEQRLLVQGGEQQGQQQGQQGQQQQPMQEQQQQAMQEGTEAQLQQQAQRPRRHGRDRDRDRDRRRQRSGSFFPSHALLRQQQEQLQLLQQQSMLQLQQLQQLQEQQAALLSALPSASLALRVGQQDPQQLRLLQSPQPAALSSHHSAGLLPSDPLVPRIPAGPPPRTTSLPGNWQPLLPIAESGGPDSDGGSGGAADPFARTSASAIMSSHGDLHHPHPQHQHQHPPRPFRNLPSMWNAPRPGVSSSTDMSGGDTRGQHTLTVSSSDQSSLGSTLAGATASQQHMEESAALALQQHLMLQPYAGGHQQQVGRGPGGALTGHLGQGGTRELPPSRLGPSGGAWGGGGLGGLGGMQGLTAGYVQQQQQGGAAALQAPAEGGPSQQAGQQAPGQVQGAAGGMFGSVSRHGEGGGPANMEQ